jgi:transaldolase
MSAAGTAVTDTTAATGTGRLAELAARIAGLWVDGVARDRIRERGLASLVERRSVTGAVLGPAGLLPAVKAGAYREQIAQIAAGAGGEPADVLLELLATDAREACDVLLPAFTAARGRTGLVVAEPDYAAADGDAEADAERIGLIARRFAASVDRPNLLVTIPATAAGRTAATAALADGISVLIGPVADPAAHTAAAQAYLAGIAAALEANRDPEQIHAAIAFALSHTDTEVDKRLWAIATDRSASFRGRTAVALARTTFAAHEELFSGEQWNRLEAAGARPPLLLWTATRARDPYYSETLYVDSLIAPGVANAMTEATLGVVAESAEITEDSLHGAFLDDARQTLADLRDLGIDFEDVARVLQATAAQRSRTAWQAVREAVADAVRKAAAG